MLRLCERDWRSGAASETQSNAEYRLQDGLRRYTIRDVSS